MSGATKAIGGLFGAIPGMLFGSSDDNNSSPLNSFQDSSLTKKQADLEARQNAEKAQRSKQLEQQRIALLRGRFGAAGGGATDGTSPDSLYGRITGR